MTVDITCPNCNFSKTIPAEQIPVGARWATCPHCKSRFEINIPETGFNFSQEQKGNEKESEIRRGVSPWENLSELGIWKGIYQTFKAVLFSPEQLFRTMNFRKGFWEPLAFGLLFGSVGTMLGFFWQFLMMSGSLLFVTQDLISQSTMGFIFLGIILISPIFVIIGIFFSSAILHLCLLLVGGGTHGFEGTFRVISYSQATKILGLLPFIGGIVGWVWQLIIQIIGLREIHETSYSKVIMAFLMPFVAIFVLFIIVLIALFVFT
jgi:hypothetical protein